MKRLTRVEGSLYFNLQPGYRHVAWGFAENYHRRRPKLAADSSRAQNSTAHVTGVIDHVGIDIVVSISCSQRSTYNGQNNKGTSRRHWYRRPLTWTKTLSTSTRSISPRSAYCQRCCAISARVGRDNMTTAHIGVRKAYWTPYTPVRVENDM